MKFIFLLIAPIFSFKLCSNCKHFIEPKSKSNIIGFGKCNLFPKIKDLYSMNDKKETVKTKEDMYYCSTARVYSHMCDIEGKFYESK